VMRKACHGQPFNKISGDPPTVMGTEEFPKTRGRAVVSDIQTSIWGIYLAENVLDKSHTL
jgi:hypothetical protein